MGYTNRTLGWRGERTVLGPTSPSPAKHAPTGDRIGKGATQLIRLERSADLSCRLLPKESRHTSLKYQDYMMNLLGADSLVSFFLFLIWDEK